MKSPGSVFSLTRIAAFISRGIQIPDRAVQIVIAVSFIIVWSATFLVSGDDNWKVMLLGLIPTLLTFNARRRITILLVSAASLVASALNIWIVNPEAYIDREGKRFAIEFFVTLLLSLCYFANRQRNILSAEMRKRHARDAEMHELQRAYQALKRSQRALRRMSSMLAENAPVAIAQLTPELDYVMANPIYLNLIRMQTGDASFVLNGQNLNNVRAIGTLAPQWDEALGRIKAGLPVKLSGQPSLNLIFGGTTFYDWTIWPVKDEDGTIESILVLGSDVTERMRAEKELELALTQLEKSNQAKDSFLANLSHELRTPLTPILGWAQIIQDYPSDHVVTFRGLKAIERNARLQTQLVDDLLDLSKISMGKIELNREAIDLNDIVKQVLDNLQCNGEAVLPVIELRLSAEPQIVFGDAVRIEQIIGNLVSNAIKFTPQEGTVRIITSRNGNDCNFIVSDDGAGITSEVLPSLFEPFKQADSSITRRFGGMGIGLSIVRSLVELHRGRISASSPGSGLGSTFTVSIPAFGSMPGTVEPIVGQSDLQSLKGLRVLVLEDSRDTREIIEAIITSRKGVVHLAETVEGALLGLAEFRPHIVVSDLALPELDGYEFVRQMRETEYGSRVPAIALSGFATESDRERALSAGFDQHLAKPVDAEALIGTILSLNEDLAATALV